MSLAVASGSPAFQVPAEEPQTGNYFVAAYPPLSVWSAKQVPAFHDVLRRPSRDAIGIYVHLPFCPQKCDYCYYVSYTHQNSAVVDRYIDALIRELELYGQQAGVMGRSVRFVYFGGGTPSTLSNDQLIRLVDGLKRVLSWEQIEEVTFECAPRSVREDFLMTMHEAGVTRVSMGVQSLDNELLKTNGRVHLAEDVVRAVQRIQKRGFNQLNLDLMCGLMGETEEQWRVSVRKTIELGPDSVTIYQTEIPTNTQLYREIKDGTVSSEPVSWDTKRERLDYGFRELERAGYSVASAYHAVKDPQRHPFRYQDHLWRGGDMLGLGVAAFGYFAGVHYQNEVTLQKYETAVEDGHVPVNRAYALSVDEQLVREFVLQLKLGEVAVEPFRRRFGVEIQDAFSGPLRALSSKGFLSFDDDAVRLTRSGLLRVDRLLPHFYDPRFHNVRYT
jgi:oxygen-independent coproporphyrinogen-3 oxidase